MQKQKKYGAKIISAFLLAFFLAVAKAQTALGQWDKSKYTGTGLPSTPLADVISKFALWLLAIFGFIAVIGFVISGIIYLTSAGDEDRQKTAKRAMIYSITGVVVGLAGLIIIFAADSFLRGTNSAVINNAANSPVTGAGMDY